MVKRDFKKMYLLPFQPSEGRSWLGPQGQEQVEGTVGVVGDLGALGWGWGWDCSLTCSLRSSRLAFCFALGLLELFGPHVDLLSTFWAVEQFLVHSGSTTPLAVGVSFWGCEGS